MTMTPEFPMLARELRVCQLFRLPTQQRVHMVREITRHSTGSVKQVAAQSTDASGRRLWFGARTQVVRVTAVDVKVQALALEMAA